VPQIGCQRATQVSKEGKNDGRKEGWTKDGETKDGREEGGWQQMK
jgi:hypothetical protein